MAGKSRNDLPCSRPAQSVSHPRGSADPLGGKAAEQSNIHPQHKLSKINKCAKQWEKPLHQAWTPSGCGFMQTAVNIRWTFGVDTGPVVKLERKNLSQVPACSTMASFISNKHCWQNLRDGVTRDGRCGKWLIITSFLAWAGDWSVRGQI